MTRFDKVAGYTTGDTNIYIRDSGWRNTGLTSPDGTHNESGTETEIVAKASGKGQAIRLISVSLNMAQEANINDDAIIQKYDSNSQDSDLTFGKVDLGSMGNPVWVLSGRIDLRDSVGQDTLKWLAQMPRTRGYKELGIPTSSSKNYHLIRWINPDNHNHGSYSHKTPVDGSSITNVSTYGMTPAIALSHVHVRVKSVRFTQLGGDFYGFVGYKMTLVETL